MSVRTLWHISFSVARPDPRTAPGPSAAAPTCTSPCPQPDPPPAGPRLDTPSPSEHPAGLSGVSRLPPTPAGDQLWAPTGADAAAQHHRPREPPEGSQ